MQRKHIATTGVAALLVLVMAVVAFGGLGSVGAQSTEAPADRTVTVSANGEATAAPDKAVLRIAVTAEGDDPAAIRDSLSADAAELRTALDELGVDYKSVHYDIDERHRPPEAREEAPDAARYQGMHGFEVTLQDPDRTGEVIDAATEAGAEVSNVRLTLSDERRKEFRDTAITNAMEDARAQAETVAAAGNLNITDVATVDASERQYRPVRYEMAEAGGDAAAPPTTIDQGDVSVTYSVTVTYNATT